MVDSRRNYLKTEKCTGNFMLKSVGETHTVCENTRGEPRSETQVKSGTLRRANVTVWKQVCFTDCLFVSQTVCVFHRLCVCFTDCVCVSQTVCFTDCHIHFPDCNKQADCDKSNCVSLSGEIPNIEYARIGVRVRA